MVGLPHHFTINNHGLDAYRVGNKTVCTTGKVKDPANLATADRRRVKHYKIRRPAQGNQAAIRKSKNLGRTAA